MPEERSGDAPRGRVIATQVDKQKPSINCETGDVIGFTRRHARERGGDWQDSSDLLYQGH